MTQSARDETLHFLCALVPLWLMAIAGCVAFGQWQQLQTVEPDLRFYRTVALHAMNQVPMVIGRKPAQVGLMCQTF